MTTLDRTRCTHGLLVSADGTTNRPDECQRCDWCPRCQQVREYRGETCGTCGQKWGES